MSTKKPGDANQSKGRMNTIYELARISVLETEGIDSLSQKVASEILRIMDVDCCQIALKERMVEEDRLVVYFNTGWNLEGRGLSTDDQERYILSGGVVGEVAHKGETTYIPDLDDKSNPLSGLYKRYNDEMRCELAVAIRDKAGSPIGVLNVEHRDKNFFDETDITFLESIASIIENHFVIRFLLDAQAEIYQVANLQEDYRVRLEQIAKGVLKVLRADSVLLFEYESGEFKKNTTQLAVGNIKSATNELTVSVPDAGKHIPQEVIAHNSSIFANRTEDDAILSGRTTTEQRVDNKQRFYEREGVKSSAALLLRSPKESEILGVMFVNYKRYYEVEKLSRYMEIFASLAGTAIKTSVVLQ
ncbi:MAG: GAF domain-containing protein [Candidatus Zixiibacteriota bacterium]